MWNKLGKIDWRTISLRIFIFTTLLYLIVLFSNIFFNNIFSFYFNANYLFVIAISAITFYFSQIINDIPENKREKSKLIKVFSYLFLGTLLLVNVNQFLRNEIIINYFFEVSCFSVMLGFLSFYAHQGKIEKETEQEERSEIKEEQKRYEEFPEKFFKINKIPVFRKIVLWMYKEGWNYSILLIIIIIFSIILKLWNISSIPYNIDEGIYYIIIKNLQNGLIFPALDSGIPYIRTFAFTYTSYFLNYIFNNILISIRSVSLLFGTLLIPLSYIFTKKLFNKTAGIICTLLITINPFFISYSIQGRHYIMSLFFYLLFFYLIFFNKKNNNLILFTIAIILGLNHEFIFLLTPILFYKFLEQKNKKFLYILILIATLFFIQYFIFTKMATYANITFNPKTKEAISINIFKQEIINDGIKRLFFLIQPMLLIIIFCTMQILKNIKKINKKQKMFFLQMFFELSFFSFILIRNQIRYRETALIILIIGISYCLSLILNQKNKFKKINLIILLLFLYLATPISINYPPTQKIEKPHNISNAELLIKNFNNKLGFLSISSNGVYSNYKETSKYSKKNQIVFTTDMYNTEPYIKIDYIINDYMKNYFCYKDNEKYISIYNNIEFIDLEFLKNLQNKTKKEILIILDSRYKTQLNSDTISYILDNFFLIGQTKKNEIGLIDNTDDNTIYFYSSNQE